MVCNDFLKNTCNPSCKKIHGCIKSYDNRRYVTCEERNKKYTLDNARSVNIANYHMDGGVIQNDPEKKCDFLIFVILSTFSKIQCGCACYVHFYL